MEISYNEYPTVLFTSFDRSTTPTELPIEVVNEEVRNYLSTCKGFSEMFALIAIKNSENKGMYYFLEESLLYKIDGVDNFRNEYYSVFFSDYVKPKYGSILFRDSGQYVYLLLGKHETKKMKNTNGRYIAVALFRKDVFVGFEEGYITDNGVQVAPNGRYDSGMDVGGYISFVLITLAYAGDKDLPVMETKLKENVYLLSYPGFP